MPKGCIDDDGAEEPDQLRCTDTDARRGAGRVGGHEEDYEILAVGQKRGDDGTADGDWVEVKVRWGSAREGGLHWLRTLWRCFFDLRS